MPTYVWAAALAAVLFALIALEMLVPLERYTLKSRWAGLGFTAINVLAGAEAVYFLTLLWKALAVPALISVPVKGLVGDLAALALALLFYDFLAYWHHRLQHRFFWPIHVLHHAQTELHAANSYAHFLEKPVRFVVVSVPLSVIEFDFGGMPFVIAIILDALERFIHSPTRFHFGPLRMVLVDNRFHRIHHSLEEKHFDKNFGILFSFWDRLFGTAHEPSRGEWPATGVAGLHPPATLTDYMLFPTELMPRIRRPKTHVA